jgi:hypothetical protein
LIYWIDSKTDAPSAQGNRSYSSAASRLLQGFNRRQIATKAAFAPITITLKKVLKQDSAQNASDPGVRFR